MLEISKTIKKYPKFQKQKLERISNFTLGEKYELSLVFIANNLSKKLNSKSRNINKPTDILSFEIEKDLGEIFINIPYTIKKHNLKNKDREDFIYYIFIHGLAHLKGHDHENEKDFLKMQKLEKKIRKKFNIKNFY